MHQLPSASRVAEVLPGEWIVRASNVLHWLSGERVTPVVRYELVLESPLVMLEESRFGGAYDKNELVRRRGTWKNDAFVVRGNGIRAILTSRWCVGGVSDDNNIVVIRHGRPQTRTAGIDVLVRREIDVDEVRATVAHQSDTFGLGLEDFASLTWFAGGSER